MSPTPAVHHDTDAFRGATFTTSDLGGVTLRECDVRGMRVVGSTVDDVELWAFGGELGTVRVEGVDVTAYVIAELDRRFPERVALRSLETADDHRAAWEEVLRAWATTIDRAEALAEPLRHERVAGEWSTTETLRHLIFAIDLWAGAMVREQDAPFHPLGLPPGDSDDDAAGLGLTPDESPSWDEVVGLHRDRCRQVSELLASTSDNDLAATRTRTPVPSWGEQTYPVGTCLWIIQKEHAEHRRYAERDLDRLAPGMAS
jgi:hypothetical protein